MYLYANIFLKLQTVKVTLPRTEIKSTAEIGFRVLWTVAGYESAYITVCDIVWSVLLSFNMQTGWTLETTFYKETEISLK
jgi:hypothetical protein